MENKAPAPQNIQDIYLNTMRRDKVPVTIVLIGGVRLVGKIRGFDKYSVVLESNNQDQLIFKHAISTISQTRRGTPDLHSNTATESTRESRTEANSPEA